MTLEEQHNKLSEEFDDLTAQLKEFPTISFANENEYQELWNKRAEIKRQMYDLEKSITG